MRLSSVVKIKKNVCNKTKRGKVPLAYLNLHLVTSRHVANRSLVTFEAIGLRASATNDCKLWFRSCLRQLCSGAWRRATTHCRLWRENVHVSNVEFFKYHVRYVCLGIACFIFLHSAPSKLWYIIIQGLLNISRQFASGCGLCRALLSAPSQCRMPRVCSALLKLLLSTVLRQARDTWLQLATLAESVDCLKKICFFFRKTLGTPYRPVGSRFLWF